MSNSVNHKNTARIFQLLSKLKWFHLWVIIAPLIILFSSLVHDGESVYCLIPGFSQSGGTHECLLRQLTGFSCASCGLTGSFHAIVRGQFLTAVSRHVLGIPLFAFFIFLGFTAFCDIAGFKHVPDWWFGFYRRNSGSILAVFIGLLMGFFVVRFIGEIINGYSKLN